MLQRTVEHASAGRLVLAGALGGFAVAATLFWIQSAVAGERGAAAPTVSAKNIPTAKADSAYEFESNCVSTSTYVEMAGLTQTVRLGGNATKPIIAALTSQFSGNGLAQVRLVIDGVVQPNGEDLPIHDGELHVRSMGAYNFLSEPQPPGNRKVQIEWRSSNGFSVCANFPTLTVFHK